MLKLAKAIAFVLAVTPLASCTGPKIVPTNGAANTKFIGMNINAFEELIEEHAVMINSGPLQSTAYAGIYPKANLVVGFDKKNGLILDVSEFKPEKSSTDGRPAPE